MNPPPVKIPMFLSSPVTAKMQERESYPPNLTIAYPISCYFLIPSTMFLKEQAADFLPELTTGPGLLRVEPPTLHVMFVMTASGKMLTIDSAPTLWTTLPSTDHYSSNPLGRFSDSILISSATYHPSSYLLPLDF